MQIVVAESGQPEPLWSGRLRRWRPGGYADSRHANPRDEVEVLTPRSTVRAIEPAFVRSPAADYFGA